jgi:hypothetical protein
MNALINAPLEGKQTPETGVDLSRTDKTEVSGVRASLRYY